MSTTPQMGLVLPVPSSSAPDWGGLLNGAFNLIDTHDHTAGHGVPVPSAGIGINADLPFNGFNLTQARTLRLQQQGSAPALAADAGALYATTAGDLWFNNGAGQHIQITSGSALSAASLGGISGLGGTSAGVAFNNATKTFTFTQAATQAALLDAGPLVIRDTAASALGITLQSPVGIAGAYSLTLPTALPAANALLSLGTGGALTAFGTMSGSDLTLPGNLTLAGSVSGNSLIKTTGSGLGIALQGNCAATSPNADVVLGSTAARTAGFLAVFANQIGVTNKLFVDYQGLLSLASQAAPLQPSSILNAFTLNAGITDGNGSGDAGYWKDANGVVHMKGFLRNSTGGVTAAFVTTSPIPAGFRPKFNREFAIMSGLSAVIRVIVGATGTIASGAGLANTDGVILDGIQYLAEQ